jgi:predicted adenylyl cyclase CyaB
MREVELKAVVTDVEGARKRLARAGASLEFEGALEDRRYDTEDGSLSERDEVLRVRSYRSGSGVRTLLDWKGPADTMTGYKVREEISTEISDADALLAMLDKLGYVVIREIDRRIVQYRIAGTTVRFESYPRMDDLVEVEGDPPAIERAIELLGMSRGEFTGDSLAAFVARFERRTGVLAAVSEREMGETAD